LLQFSPKCFFFFFFHPGRHSWAPLSSPLLFQIGSDHPFWLLSVLFLWKPQASRSSPLCISFFPALAFQRLLPPKLLFLTFYCCFSSLRVSSLLVLFEGFFCAPPVAVFLHTSTCKKGSLQAEDSPFCGLIFSFPDSSSLNPNACTFFGTPENSLSASWGARFLLDYGDNLNH